MLARFTNDMLSLPAILLTSSLLLVLSMVGAVMWLAALRVHSEQQAVPVQAPDADA